MRSAGTIPSDTKSLSMIAGGGNEEDTGGTPGGLQSGVRCGIMVENVAIFGGIPYEKGY